MTAPARESLSSARCPPAPGAMTVAPDLVRGHETAAAELVEGYPAGPLAVTARAAARRLGEVEKLLGGGSLPPPAGQRMHRAAARLCGLVGNAQLDVGQKGPALRSLARAAVHAEIAGDRTQQAWVHFLRADLHDIDGDPRAALVEAEAGLAVAVDNTPIAARLYSEGLARAHAKLANPMAALTYLNISEGTLAACPPEQTSRAGWHPDRLHPAEWRDIAATVHLLVGNHSRAADLAEHARRQFDQTDAIGHRSYARLDLAEIRLATGDGDDAVGHISAALALANNRKLAHIGASASRLTHLARGRAPDRAVNNLIDQLRHWHTGALR